MIRLDVLQASLRARAEEVKARPRSPLLEGVRTRLAMLGADGAAILAVVLWGFNIPVSKIPLEHINPFAFSALRVLFGAIVAVIAVLVLEKNFSISKRDLIPLTVLGLVGVALAQILFFTGLSLTYASHMSLFMGLNPVFAVLIMGAVAASRLTWLNWTGIAICLAGLAVITGIGMVAVDSNILLGDLLALASGAVGAVYIVFSRRFLQRYSALKVQSYALVVSTVVLLVIGFPALVAQDWGSVPATSFAALIFSGLTGTVLAMVFWLVSVKRIGPVRTSIYQYLLPVVGLILSIVILNEALTPRHAAGAVMILCGMVLALHARRMRKV